MLKPEETAAGFVAQAASSAAAEVALPEDARRALVKDAEALGLFGLLSSLAFAEPPTPDPAVARELTDVLARDLRDALGAAPDAGLEPLLDRFVAEKGERAGELLARLIARVIYEVYDLSAHRFVQDDVLFTAEAMAWGAAGQDAREAARRIGRISRIALRNLMGHLDSQLELVHRLGHAEAPVLYAEIDGRLDEFAPRVFAQRLPSLVKVLLRDEKKFRFAFVLWCRLRGVVIGREPLLAAADAIIPERPVTLLQALEERRAARAALRQADEAFPLARRIEAALRAGPLRRTE